MSFITVKMTDASCCNGMIDFKFNITAIHYSMETPILKQK